MTDTTTPSTVSTPEARTALLDRLSSLLKPVGLPGIDVAGIIESRRKDLDALAAANDAALQGVQSIAHAEAEMLKALLGQLQSVLQRSPEGDATRGTALKQAVQGVLTDLRGLAAAGYRAQAETFAVISRRAQEDLQEFTARLQPVRG
jgi:hypothetical protein